MIYPAIYIAALVTANLLVAWFGPWFSPINAFVLIGLDLSLRDKLHEEWKNDKLVLKMGGLIATASVVSYLWNPAAGPIALASFLAFALAMSADTIAYHFLRDKPWMIRSNGSNVAGAAVGGGIEGVVKGIIKWFSTLLKAKKSGQSLGEFARTAADATSELSKVTAEEAIAMDAVADGSNSGVGTFVENNKIMLIVVVVVILAVVGFMVFRKK